MTRNRARGQKMGFNQNYEATWKEWIGMIVWRRLRITVKALLHIEGPDSCTIAAVCIGR